MPEGDTVFRAAQRLHRALAGDTLVAADLRVPALATADLTGSVVSEVVPRGKHLLMRLVHDGEALTLHSHLRMDGAWLLAPATAPVRVPAHEVRAVLRTRRWTAVGRLLGELDLVRTRDEASLVGHLGPDVLDPAFDGMEAVRRLRSRPGRPVAEALLDQRDLAGLGNELVTEVCFLRGLHPATPMGEVGDVDALVALARRVTSANATRAVRSTTGDLRRGRTSYVYGRAGRPCRRCGTPVRKAEGLLDAQDPTAPDTEDIGRRPTDGRTSDGRTTDGRTTDRRTTDRVSYWCPTCQPLPARRAPHSYE